MKIDTFINAVRKLESRALSRSLSSKEQRQLEAFVDTGIETISKPSNIEVFGTSKNVGKHKIPRYMYRLTTESNYQSMLKDGYIKPHASIDSPPFVFLFDMKNFTKFWRKTPLVQEQPRTTLLTNMIFDEKENVVLLKIPTKELDARKLRLRRQNLCRSGQGGFTQQLQNFSNNPYKFTTLMKMIKYICSGEPATKSPLYNQLKEAIEFMTPDAIPIEKVKLLGKTTINRNTLDKAHNQTLDVPEIWKALTSGSPEYKAFEQIFPKSSIHPA